MVKFLDVGSGSGSGEHFFKDRGEIVTTRLDADPNNHPDLVHDICNPLPEEHQGIYNIVFSSHLLEHIDYRAVSRAIKHIVQAARIGGEVWIFVPSMEWAAREILLGKNGLGIQGTIFGGQTTEWDYHRAGFTKDLLVAALAGAGCKDIKVGESKIAIVLDGVTYDSCQNMAIGVRER